MSEELRQLVLACRSGDELAWETLVRRFQGRVFALALHYVRSREDARDVAQEVFIRVYRGLPGFERTESFVPWLLRVTRTCAIDHTRRRRARPPAQDIQVDEMHALADGGARPDEQTERAARRRLVHRALDSLGELHREILHLQEIQEIPLHEVADLLGIPLGTAKSRASRARVELAQRIVELDGPDGLVGEAT